MIILEKRLGDVFSILSHAVDMAVLANEKVQFTFNGVEVVVVMYTDVSSRSCQIILNAVQDGKSRIYL